MEYSYDIIKWSISFSSRAVIAGRSSSVFLRLVWFEEEISWFTEPICFVLLIAVTDALREEMSEEERPEALITSGRRFLPGILISSIGSERS